MASVQKRGSSYRITSSAGYNSDGKQIRKTMTWTPDSGMNQKQIDKELERQKVLFDEKVKNGQYTDPSIRFKDFAEQWFADYGKEHLRERTYLRYIELSERTYRAIGHIQLYKLQPKHLIEFYRQLAEAGQNKNTGGSLSPKTIKHYHGFVSAVLERAVKWGIISDNPAKRVDPPKVQKTQIDFLDDEQAGIFMQALEDEPLENRVMFYILILTGMRRGELMGLEWPDIDFDKSTIYIQRTSQYSPQVGIFTDTTKTEQSKRILSIPAELTALLKVYRAEQAERIVSLGDRWSSDWSKHPRLFTKMDGTPMFPNIPYIRLQKILNRAGLPKVSLHSLRHTNATLMIGSGLDIRSVSGRLGHSQTSTTLNIYAEFLYSANEAASEVVADKLLPVRKQE